MTYVLTILDKIYYYSKNSRAFQKILRGKETERKSEIIYKGKTPRRNSCHCPLLPSGFQNLSLSIHQITESCNVMDV